MCIDGKVTAKNTLQNRGFSARAKTKLCIQHAYNIIKKIISYASISVYNVIMQNYTTIY
jgi:hypothetical protein